MQEAGNGLESRHNAAWLRESQQQGRARQGRARQGRDRDQSLQPSASAAAHEVSKGAKVAIALYLGGTTLLSKVQENLTQVGCRNVEL